MSDSQEQKLITMNIDGRDVQVPSGVNLIDALSDLGTEVPHYCYHPKLSVSGNCRMCLVEMGMPMRDRQSGKEVLDEDGKVKIGWMPKPAIACNSKTMDGMHIRTHSPMVEECREGVMEFLLVNHPLDCPICDQAGECRLQEFATDYGRGYSRFIEDKNVKPKRTRIGPRVMLDDERCILCSRCIRFCDEIIKDPVLGFVDRGSYSTLSCYPGKQLTSNYSLNTVDICPVGALTSTDFRFKMRVWFLKNVPSICTESSVGVNTEVWVREGKIYRITPRRNDAVNDTWMSDSGRALYHQVEAPERLNTFRVAGVKASVGDALGKVAEWIRAGKVGIVCNGHLSVEEYYLLEKLKRVADARVWMAGHSGDGDGMLISNDRSPNIRGALLTGLVAHPPESGLPESMGQALAAGEVETLLVFGEDLHKEGSTVDFSDRQNVVYFGTHANGTSEKAGVVIPLLTVFERSGTFINQQFRLQKFLQAIPGPAGTLPNLVVLSRLLGLVKQESLENPSLAEVWQDLSSDISEFSDITYATIPSDGYLLDSQRWQDVTFSEGESLHYKPQLESAAD